MSALPPLHCMCGSKVIDPAPACVSDKLHICERPQCVEAAKAWVTKAASTQTIRSATLDLLDAIDQSAHGRLPERMSKACVAMRAALSLPLGYVDSRGVPLATRTEECRICDGPVASTDGYRKVRGVWICKACCDALGCRTLTDRGVNPLTDVDLANVNMSDLTEPTGPPRTFTIRRRGAVVWQGEATSLEDAIGKALTSRESTTHVACTSLPLQPPRVYFDSRGAPLDAATSEATSTSEAGGDDAPKVCPK